MKLRRYITIFCAQSVIIIFAVAGLYAQENLKILAEQFIKQKEYSKALDIYKRIRIESPDDVENLKSLAKLYGIINEYDNALRIYNELLKRFPDDYDIIFRTAQVYSWKADYPVSEKYFNRIISESPDYIDAYLGIARVYYWQQEYTSARHILKKALSKSPSDPEILSLLVKINFDAGNYNKARFYNNLLLIHDPGAEDGICFDKLLKLYTIEVEGGFDRVSTMEDWKEGNVAFSYKPTKKFTGIIQGTSYKRFGKIDHQIAVNCYMKISNALNVHGLLSKGLENEFLPNHRINMELEYAGNNIAGLIGGYYLKFSDESVWINIFGFTYYSPFNIYCDYKYFNDTGNQNHSIDTHFFRFNYLKENRYKVSVGYAAGGESFRIASKEELSEIKSYSYLFDLTYHLNATLGIRTSFAYTDRNGSYNRTTLRARLIIKL